MEWWEWLIIIALTTPGWLVALFWIITMFTLGKADP